MEVDVFAILYPLGQWYRDMVIISGYSDTSGILLALSNSLCFTVAPVGQLSSLLSSL